MKIKHILTESTALAGRYWDFPEANDVQNGEANHIAEINREYYKEFFKEYYESGAVPVFSVDNTDEPSMTNIPEDEEYSSPGRRGEVYVKKLTGLDIKSR